MSHQTVSRWTGEIGKSIKKNLESEAANFKFYALVIDENTDATNKVHFAIFIRGIDSEYNVIEEMPSLVPLKDRSKPLNLYEAVGITLK